MGCDEQIHIADWFASQLQGRANSGVVSSDSVCPIEQFPNVANWKTKIEARPAYQRMLAKARPDGMVGSPPALPKHAPSGPRAKMPAASK